MAVTHYFFKFNLEYHDLILVVPNVQASMQVDAKNATIRLPNSLNVKIDVGNALAAHAKGVVNTQIDVHENIPIVLKGKYPADLKFNITTPITVDLDYKTNIHVETKMPLETTTDLVYQSKLLPKLRLKIDVPIQLDVPFHLKKTYQLPIKINFNGDVDLELNEKIDLKVDHVFVQQLLLNDPIEMSNISIFDAVMENLNPETKADIKMKIDVPLKAIHQ